MKIRKCWKAFSTDTNLLNIICNFLHKNKKCYSFIRNHNCWVLTFSIRGPAHFVHPQGSHLLISSKGISPLFSWSVNKNENLLTIKTTFVRVISYLIPNTSKNCNSKSNSTDRCPVARIRTHIYFWKPRSDKYFGVYGFLCTTGSNFQEICIFTLQFVTTIFVSKKKNMISLHVINPLFYKKDAVFLDFIYLNVRVQSLYEILGVKYHLHKYSCHCKMYSGSTILSFNFS